MVNLHRYIEHQSFSVVDDDKLKELLLRRLKSSEATQNLKDLCLMGMDYDFRKDEFFVSYYVGVDWIDEKKRHAMMVTPKIAGVDFQTMLMKCFATDKVKERLDKIFFIRTDDKPIEIDSDAFQLEPLIIIYFINLINLIVDRGLRSDYIFTEEKLNGKIKGKINYGRYIKNGFATGRKDIIDCRYQEYSVNCLDNRILKKALMLSQQMLKRNEEALGLHSAPLKAMIDNSLVAFRNVSEEVTLQELHRVHVHPMYKLYRQAMPLAKMIIRKQGYCVETAVNNLKQKFPPFIIDMPILFERYVYSLLVERYGAKAIQYQLSTYGNSIDFGKKDENLVIDTKYIPSWEYSNEHENIRQLSGYARNKKLREGLGLDIGDETTICPCLIIFPNIDGLTTFKGCTDSLYSDSGTKTIQEYVKFKKIGIRLPNKN